MARYFIGRLGQHGNQPLLRTRWPLLATACAQAFGVPINPFCKGISLKPSQAIIAFILVFSATVAVAADGLISIKSQYSAKETMDRLENIVKQRGLNVFVRIDHSAGASTIGKNLRPAELLVFGNPQGGTPFMECAQTVGIDLPLKALVWQDAEGQVWLGYNSPEFLAKRHGVADCKVVENLSKALAGIAGAAAVK